MSAMNPARENVMTTVATLSSSVNAAAALSGTFLVMMSSAPAIGISRFSISARSFGLLAMPEPA